MPYVIKKTDGNIIATITDGTVDTASTSLTLIGKNYKGIGELYNENLVFLLESFANSSPPGNQIKGQVWFNTNTSKLNVYDGANWRPVGSPFVSTARPSNLVSGDFWIDTSSQQLKFYDGINLITAGPIYTKNQGKSGWEVEEIVSDNGDIRLITSLYAASIRMAILNPVEFKPLVAISGFTTSLTPLQAGLSFSTLVTGNTIHAVVETAQALVDSVDGNLDTTKFVRSDKSGSIGGNLSITGTNGVTIGPSANISIYIDQATSPNNTVIGNQVINSKMVLRTRSTGFQDSVIIDPAVKKVGIYQNDTWQSLGGITPQMYINGNTYIEGTLTVVGATQFTNSTTLQITDKNIELAVVGSPDNSTADGAGVTVLGGAGNNKTIVWQRGGIAVLGGTLPSWSINDNIRIPSTNGYYVGSSPVINATTLGATVVSSSLTSLGRVTTLDVADFNFTGNQLRVTGNNFVLGVPADQIISLSNLVRFNNVANPQFQYDVANKDYVDRVKTSVNYVTIDITGFITPNSQAVPQIEALIPAGSVNSQDIVRALCLTYTYNGTSTPVVTRIVKSFICQLITGIRTWVWDSDITV